MMTFVKCPKCSKIHTSDGSFGGYCSECKKSEIINTIKERQDKQTPPNRHMDICTELNNLYLKKNKDYGNSFSKTFEEFGLTMSAIRLNDKLERFKRLINNNNEVKDESIRDTLVDLANYAIMTVMEIDKNER